MGLIRIFLAVVFWVGSSRAAGLAPITVDYPEQESVFPPEITAPTFLWRDTAQGARVWRIDISFADGSPVVHTTSQGPRLEVGPIDQRCVAETNELPKLTPQQASAHTWKPDAAMWNLIKRRATTAPATVTVTGLAGGPVSRGQVTIRTSLDPVGAPIFYRDVPLMPSETEKGVIKPLVPYAVRLIAWRLRNIAEPRSRLLLDGMPVCANCHSFSADGKTLGMDLDGLQNNKGLYTLTPVARRTQIRNENVIQWSSTAGKLKSPLRVGFMSQVSPDGRYVVTTLDASQVGLAPPLPAPARSNYYVANFKDYRFLQVFDPARGILSWYSRETGILQPLPGADDPRIVQTNAVWSPDGKYLVFARAEAKDPDPQGAPTARFANDPHELPMQYDLYRIPFRHGQGGAPEAIAGASRNGKSNAFPKVSPDGRWIVFVQCRNGLLMRPDSRLYIVPVQGGTARPLRANLALMNSWHSFSPNGRWLVFSSKSRSPYTQMYLTHIDEQGNDSPAILIENTTAANRAVNIPEFVNIAPGGMEELGGPAIDYYRLFDSALYLQKNGRYREAAAEWERVLEIRPDDALAQGNLGVVLRLAGDPQQASAHLRKATELRLRGTVEEHPDSAPARNALGTALLEAGRTGEALEEFRKATKLDPGYAPAFSSLGATLAAEGSLDEAESQLRQALTLDPRQAEAYYQLGRLSAGRRATGEAIAFWERALRVDSQFADAHRALGDALYAWGEAAAALSHWREVIRLRPNDAATLRQAAWLLATWPDPAIRDGREAVAFAVRALQLSGRDPNVLDALAAAYAETGQYAEAVLTARRALALPGATSAIHDRAELYKSRKPFREPGPSSHQPARAAAGVLR